jgi:chromosome segregation ATPase
MSAEGGGGGGGKVGASGEELDRLQIELEGSEDTAANLEVELEHALTLNRDANDEKRRLKDRAERLSKEVEFLRAENKRLMAEASGREAGARLLDDEERRREIEEHRKKQVRVWGDCAHP